MANKITIPKNNHRIIRFNNYKIVNKLFLDGLIKL